jgi:hypothetical protein
MVGRKREQQWLLVKLHYRHPLESPFDREWRFEEMFGEQGWFVGSERKQVGIEGRIVLSGMLYVGRLARGQITHEAHCVVMAEESVSEGMEMGKKA